MGLKTKPAPGTKVRLTGVFLKNTGQQAGSEGTSTWLTEACKCVMCQTNCVAVNEPHSAALDKTGYEDVPDEIRLKMRRHFNLANLEIVGAPPKAEDYP